MKTLGIDPGLKGGLSLLGPGSVLLERHPMPTRRCAGGRPDLDVGALVDLIQYACPDRVAIEQPPAAGMRPTGLRSVWYCYGVALGIVEGEFIPTVRVLPATWQAHFWTRQKGRSKAFALRKANELWPEESWLCTPRSTKPHDGPIDAALVAHWAILTGAATGGSMQG